MIEVAVEDTPFDEKLLVTDIGDIAEMCKAKGDPKYLSTLIYMSLRYFEIKRGIIDKCLKNIGLMTAETCHKWATVFMKGNYEEFSSDLRGGKQTDSFYDTFPEIEADARSFVVQACSQGQTYGDVLKLFFSQLCKSSVHSRRRISNRNLNEN